VLDLGGDARTFSYVVDAEDRLTGVNAAWQAFATENAGPSVASVVGTSLWQHVSDGTTRHLYSLLFERVRAAQRPLRVAFRCDAPGQRRFMSLEIAPRPDGVLVLHSRMLQQEDRAPVSLLAGDAVRSDAWLLMCSWCKRVELAGTWWEVEEAVHAARLLCEEDPAPQITHGICADCERIVHAALEEQDPRP
jgi:hypothetical protein